MRIRNWIVKKLLLYFELRRNHYIVLLTFVLCKVFLVMTDWDEHRLSKRQQLLIIHRGKIDLLTRELEIQLSSKVMRDGL